MGYLSDRCNSPKWGKQIYGVLAGEEGGSGRHISFPPFAISLFVYL